MTSGSLFCISDGMKTSAGGAASPSSHWNISVTGAEFGRVTFVVATDPRCSSVLSCYWGNMRQRTDCSLQTSFITSAKKGWGGGGYMIRFSIRHWLSIWGGECKKERDFFQSTCKSTSLYSDENKKVLLLEWMRVTHDSLTMLLHYIFHVIFRNYLLNCHDSFISMCDF